MIDSTYIGSTTVHTYIHEYSSPSCTQAPSASQLIVRRPAQALLHCNSVLVAGRKLYEVGRDLAVDAADRRDLLFTRLAGRQAGKARAWDWWDLMSYSSSLVVLYVCMYIRAYFGPLYRVIDPVTLTVWLRATLYTYLLILPARSLF